MSAEQSPLPPEGTKDEPEAKEVIAAKQSNFHEESGLLAHAEMAKRAFSFLSLAAKLSLGLAFALIVMAWGTVYMVSACSKGDEHAVLLTTIFIVPHALFAVIAVATFGAIGRALSPQEDKSLLLANTPSVAAQTLSRM